ncbi:hypothetical protein MBLNU459_g0386t1 [Dothideomycetes sp. NU459]
MFSTTGLFKGISCPEGEKCLIINCMFGHELRPQQPVTQAAAADTNAEAYTPSDASDDRAPKRRKLGTVTEQTTSAIHDFQSALRSNTSSYKGPSCVSGTQTKASRDAAGSDVSRQIRSLDRAVTPPKLQSALKSGHVSQKKPAPSKPAKKETLNPRMIPNDPAGHAKRTLFLQYMHEQMKRLNLEIVKGDHPDKGGLALGEDELVKAALDEEETIARENPKVYANIIKNRIGTYKKMKAEDWITHVKTKFAKAAGKDEKDATSDSPQVLDTGLPLEKEHLLLPEMITDQTNLAKHGYVTSPPSSADIADAEAAVAASLNYEVCDRCKSRFRVFPDRREEDGALTTNGPCVYHWGRPFAPRREKTDAIKGVKESVYSCCNDSLGTKGCTECETHVFKVSEAKRLAAVLPFVNTPENRNPSKGPNGRVVDAVTFDCEMGYTVCGFELIRLTAVSWPEGDPLVDVLVRPQGAILDLNSRFSGVWPETYNAATPYRDDSALNSLMPPPPPGHDTMPRLPSAPGQTVPITSPLPIVSSPGAARALLCSYITPSTPLIGHALENDLNAIRLCHPTIIDTIVLFPHPRGLPMRFGLKMLTKRHLGRDIQTGGASGHDSLEDARATGDLVRFAVGARWRQKRDEDGWFLAPDGGCLMPPLPSTHEAAAPARVLGPGGGSKRQRI